MAHIIVMPKLGLTMTEGVVSKWHKSEGDIIKEGDVLFEVTTDKLTNEVQANVKGTLRKRLAEEGEAVQCSNPVAIIADADENLDSILAGIESPVDVSPKSNEKKDKNQTNSQSIKNGGNNYIKASPAAKKMAADNNIDLSILKGTGPQGRIVIKDVEAYIESTKVKSSPMAAKLANELGVNIHDIHKDGRIMKADIMEAKYPGQSSSDIGKQENRIPLSNLRKVIARRMTESWNVSPMVTYNTSVDITQLKAFRDSLKDVCKSEGVKLTYNHIMMKICAKVLMEMPCVNGSIDGDELVLHDYVNIGIAVSVDNGLLVPNVKNVEAKSLMTIAAETEKLIDDARANRLAPDDMSFGTFTISNIGMYGIESFTPIINQPELAILGMAAITDKPVVVNGEVTIRPIMNLSLTADHRVIDGAEAAKFLKRVKDIVENPYLLLL